MPWREEIEVFDPRELKRVRKLATGKRLVHFAFNHDGKLLACCENGSSVTIEDLKSGKGVSFDTGNDQPNLAFGPDGLVESLLDED